MDHAGEFFTLLCTYRDVNGSVLLLVHGRSGTGTVNEEMEPRVSMVDSNSIFNGSESLDDQRIKNPFTSNMKQILAVELLTP